MKSISVVLYTKQGCTLCTDAYLLLRYLAEEYPFKLSTFDITTNPEVEKRYTLEIPVIEINGVEAFVSIIEEQPLRVYFERVLG